MWLVVNDKQVSNNLCGSGHSTLLISRASFHLSITLMNAQDQDSSCHVSVLSWICLEHHAEISEVASEKEIKENQLIFPIFSKILVTFILRSSSTCRLWSST